jgi:hypothetical protein
MNKYLIILGISLGILCGVSSSKAQDNSVAVTDADETLEYTYGSVVSASPAEIVINEYNYETDEEVNMTYGVNAETKFNNIASPQDLAKDDNVDIYYKVAGDKKIAKMITKDDTVYDAEEGTEEGDEAANEEFNNGSVPTSPETDNKINVNATRG